MATTTASGRLGYSPETTWSGEPASPTMACAENTEQRMRFEPMERSSCPAPMR